MTNLSETEARRLHHLLERAKKENDKNELQRWLREHSEQADYWRSRINELTAFKQHEQELFEKRQADIDAQIALLEQDILDLHAKHAEIARASGEPSEWDETPAEPLPLITLNETRLAEETPEDAELQARLEATRNAKRKTRKPKPVIALPGLEEANAEVEPAPCALCGRVHPAGSRLQKKHDAQLAQVQAETEPPVVEETPAPEETPVTGTEQPTPEVIEEIPAEDAPIQDEQPPAEE